MKKLCTLLLVLITCQLQAQITITQSDAPTAGTQWTEFDDDRPGIFTLGAAGANQSWNYATNFVTQDVNYLNFVSIASLPANLATQFPSANLAFNMVSDSICQYFVVNNTGIYIDGMFLYSAFANPPYNKFEFNPDNLLIPFPFTYNSTRNHTSKQEIIIVGTPTIKTVVTTMQQFNGDGYGQLTTPAGTFPNTLRIKSFQYSIDSAFMDIMGNGNFTFISSGGPSDTSVTYFHMKNGTNSFLCTVDMNMSNTAVESVSYLVNGISGIDDPSNNNEIQLFPNPVINDLLTISVRDPQIKYITIFDSNGKLVYTHDLYGADQYTLQFDVAKGLYVYQLNDQNGNIISSGKFLKQ